MPFHINISNGGSYTKEYKAKQTQEKSEEMECDLDPISNCILLAPFPLMDTKVDHVTSVIMAFVVL